MKKLLYLILFLPMVCFGATSDKVAKITTDELNWRQFDGTFTRQANENQFTVRDISNYSSIFKKGRPIRYRDAGGTWVYGMVSNSAFDTVTGTVTLVGAPMTTSYDAELGYADFNKVYTEVFVIPGYFADSADTTLLDNDLLMQYEWKRNTGYLVQVSHQVKTDDSGAAQPGINVAINGATFLSANSTVSESWVETSTTSVTIANYDINYGESLEIQADADGTNNDASNLTVICTFVLQ